jgi:hypothetical protein
MLTTEEGPEADARRERVARAREVDPSAGGFALIYARGPDGLVADEPARRRFFGEDVAAGAMSPTPAMPVMGGGQQAGRRGA